MTTERLKAVFAEALELPADKITDDLAYNSIKEWDSTAHMILVAALEDTFEVMLDTDDIIDMSSVTKVREILQKYDIEC